MIIIAVLVILLVMCIAIIKKQTDTSLAIIGGADGPTAIFLAGKLGDGFLFGIVLFVILLLTIGIILFKKIKK